VRAPAKLFAIGTQPKPPRPSAPGLPGSALGGERLPDIEL
jgi:hypothetical protein